MQVTLEIHEINKVDDAEQKKNKVLNNKFIVMKMKCSKRPKYI